LDASETLIAIFGDFATLANAADVAEAFVADQVGGIGAIVVDLAGRAFAVAGAVAAFAGESLGAGLGDLVAFDQKLFGDAQVKATCGIARAIGVIFTGLFGNVDAYATIAKQSGDTFVGAKAGLALGKIEAARGEDAEKAREYDTAKKPQAEAISGGGKKIRTEAFHRTILLRATSCVEKIRCTCLGRCSRSWRSQQDGLNGGSGVVVGR